MNPFSFNVEMYHKRINSSPDPRDILAPKMPAKREKIRSALTFMGKLATRKASFFMVGGILVVGCTARFLRNRRKRLLEKRASLQEEGAQKSPKTEMGTQTDPLPDLTSNGQFQANETTEMSEVERKLSNVTEASDDYTASECHCSSNGMRSVTTARTDPPQHSCCHLSAFIALLALHKASSCERKNWVSKSPYKENPSESTCDNRTTDSLLFNHGTKATMSASVRPCRNPFSDSLGANDTKISQLVGPRELPASPRRNESIVVKDFRNQIRINTASPPERRPNPFDTQSQGTVPCTKGPQKQGNHIPKGGFSVSGASSSNYETQDVRMQHTHDGKASMAITVEERSKSQNAPVTFRSDRHNNGGNLGPRRKPRRRGRKNHPRQSYVDLDNPKPIASPHQR